MSYTSSDYLALVAEDMIQRGEGKEQCTMWYIVTILALPDSKQCNKNQRIDYAKDNYGLHP